MAAVVRVKRRINDDPADYMVLSSKRQRKGSASEASGNNETEEVKNLFKFAGTVQQEEDCVSRAVRDAIKKEKLEKEYKLHSVNLGAITSRARAQSKTSQQSGRYKVVAQRRALQLEGLDREDKNQHDPAFHDAHVENLPFRKDCDNKENEDATESEAQRLYLLWDVEHEEKKEVMKAIERPKPNTGATIVCNDVALEREAVPRQPAEEGYVYDLYYLNRRDIDMRFLDTVLNVEAYRNDINFDQYRETEELEVYDDEDDSNDESNWRNDYPDEDPKFLDRCDAEYTGGQGYVGTFGLDDDDELGTIIDRGLTLGGSAFGQEASSEDEEQEPTYDFSQPLDSGIWSHDTTAANIWGSNSFGNSDAVADDWVSKSLDTNFDPGSGIWGSSVMNPAGSSMMNSGSSIINTSSSVIGSHGGGGGGGGGSGSGSGSGGGGGGGGSGSGSGGGGESSSSSGGGGGGGGGGVGGLTGLNPWITTTQIATAGESTSQLWAPTTDFDQYRARILQELSDDEDDNTDLT